MSKVVGSLLSFAWLIGQCGCDAGPGIGRNIAEGADCAERLPDESVCAAGLVCARPFGAQNAREGSRFTLPWSERPARYQLGRCVKVATSVGDPCIANVVCAPLGPNMICLFPSADASTGRCGRDPQAAR